MILFFAFSSSHKTQRDSQKISPRFTFGGDRCTAWINAFLACFPPPHTHTPISFLPPICLVLKQFVACISSQESQRDFQVSQGFIHACNHCKLPGCMFSPAYCPLLEFIPPMCYSWVCFWMCYWMCYWMCLNWTNVFLLSCRQRVTLEEVFRRCSQTFGCLRHNGWWTRVKSEKVAVTPVWKCGSVKVKYPLKVWWCKLRLDLIVQWMMEVAVRPVWPCCCVL